MQTIRHLLCPVDLSDPSAQALRYAAALTSVVDGDLTILYVRAAARCINAEGYRGIVPSRFDERAMVLRRGDPKDVIPEFVVSEGVSER
jgi:hypothetical protein